MSQEISLALRASPGRLSERYGYTPARFCTESSRDATCPVTGVSDPITLQCVPPSDDPAFPTKFLVREPQPATYTDTDASGSKRRSVEKPREAPCYGAVSLNKWIETRRNQGLGLVFPSRNEMSPEMADEVRSRVPPPLNNVTIRQLVNSGNFEGIENWDTTGVTDMRALFLNQTTFNRNISGWDTSNVTNMSSMFRNASSFNQPLNFNTSNVTDMISMFENASSFNQPLNFNDTSSVTNMSHMFRNASSFNQQLNFNDTSRVMYMYGMFEGARNFNQPFNFNDTSSVTNMSHMFQGARSFNQPLDFNTSNTRYMISMFEGASSFNQPLSFNTSSTRNMSRMFFGARSFNRVVYFDMTAIDDGGAVDMFTDSGGAMGIVLD